ncbi:dihydrofolate reductase [Planctomonas sp. JC2975]|uniref:dihydrofolate reductase family protein n=1 Tax=Planctomonas sp. JC2975 TaxID=2729626 RepID=UPI0014730C64|nr:dihydrofolate reductase family protein [Planctomonas sp. JC2975]NNC13626.1 dihydrofolate reductase [Planctomonas sp. JC2975]
MNSSESRRFVTAMQVTLDGFSVQDGLADWVDSWSDAIQLVGPVDTLIQGGRMHPGYGLYWSAIDSDAPEVAEMLGRTPYPREIETARLIAETPHLVVSTSLESIDWPPNAAIVRDIDELREFKERPGGVGYVVGGATLVRRLLDEGLIDELVLIVHPVVVGAGEPLLAGVAQRHELELMECEPGPGGRVHLRYRVNV